MFIKYLIMSQILKWFKENLIPHKPCCFNSGGFLLYHFVMLGSFASKLCIKLFFFGISESFHLMLKFYNHLVKFLCCLLTFLKVFCNVVDMWLVLLLERKQAS